MIDGGLRPRLLARASVGASPSTHEVLDPFTGEVSYSLPLSVESDVDAAFDSARRAQVPWARTSVHERARIVLRFHDLVLARRAEALDLLQSETGKCRRDALEEVLDVALVARHYARDAARLLRPKARRGVFPGLVKVRELHQPKGVVGVIAPWNYPLTLVSGDTIPALLAGNAVVIKPDTKTSLTALWVLDLLIEAGLPESVVRIVLGDGPGVGGMLIDRADYVMFTGSTATGRVVAQRCAARLIDCSLELGGKNAMIIRADADIARSAEIAERACFANAGQLCVSIERIYVDASIADEFTAALVERVNAIIMKPGLQWGVQMGTLISADQRDRVLAHIADAVAKGARVLAGGTARPDLGPYYVEPTVLTGVTDNMVCLTDETFGPVVAITAVSGDEEAIALANDTEYGLNASVLSRDTREAARIGARLRAGTVNINEGFAATWGSTRAPMGGMKQSGSGRRHGDAGLLKYTESQTVATARLLGFGAPFGLSDEQWGETMITAMGVMKRLGLK
jgi:succinate-semialdehyde dehydrogenase/glutarate-semialdehyde dehydrogenase